MDPLQHLERHIIFLYLYGSLNLLIDLQIQNPPCITGMIVNMLNTYSVSGTFLRMYVNQMISSSKQSYDVDTITPT